MTEEITVTLDRLSREALRVLIADGTPMEQAVRQALVETAENTATPARPAVTLARRDETYDQWLIRQASTAPEFTDYQKYVLTAVFIEGRRTWLNEAQWRASTTPPPPEM